MTTSLSRRISQTLSPIFSHKPPSPLFTHNPFAELQREMSDAFDRFRVDWNGEWPPSEFVPSIDLSETDIEVQARMDVPGFKADEIDVEVSGNTLRVSGEHKEAKEEKGRTYHRVERRNGSFARALTLPTPVKENQVSAECKDGVLTITLPKCEVAKTQKVRVVSK